MTRVSTTTPLGTAYLATQADGAVVGTLGPLGLLGSFPTWSAYGRTEAGQPNLTPWGDSGYRSLLPANVGLASHGTLPTLWLTASRVYDPALGQYLTPDSVFPTTQYTYAANNPTSLVDPTGHEGPIGALIGGGLGLVGGVLQAVAEHQSFSEALLTVAIDTGIGAATGLVADYAVNPLVAYMALAGGNLVTSVADEVVANRALQRPWDQGLLSLPQLTGYAVGLALPAAGLSVASPLIEQGVPADAAKLAGLLLIHLPQVFYGFVIEGWALSVPSALPAPGKGG